MLAGTTTWAEIDLDAIASNVSAFKKHVGEKVEIAVVKASAYGHGAVPVAKAALEAGATRLAGHRSVEGVELRQAHIEAPVLIMGYTPPDGASPVEPMGPLARRGRGVHARSSQAACFLIPGSGRQGGMQS